MMKPRNIAENTRFYRRGSIMGLTVAETFIILVFALLLLLLLLRNQAENSELELQEKIKEFEELKDETQKWKEWATIPDIPTILNLLTKMQSDERKKLTEFMARNDLHDRLEISKDFERQLLAMDPSDRDALKKIIGSPSFSQIVNRSEEITKIIEKSPDELISVEQDASKWRKMNSDSELSKTLDQIAQMSQDERKKLTEFMARNDLHDRLEIFMDFERKLLAMNPEEREKLSKMMNSQDFSNLINSDYDLSKIVEQLDSNTLVSTEIANKIKNRLGEIVREFGGEIGPDNVISVPSDKIFESGNAELTIEVQTFLREFCQKFIKALSEDPDHIQDIRVEGHSSSEWDASTSVQDRYLKNLDLSQRRAYAVLSYCLEQMKDTQLFDWTTQKITAVGFSSARPVLDDQLNEDKEKSRRVAFSYIVNYD